jgi:hypothetical protein
MNPESKAYRTAQVVDEISKWTVGMGVLVVALAPLSIPILILTAVALVPLLVPLVAVALLALPVLLIRKLRKRSGPGEGGRSLRVGTVNAERAG